jgi:hypothetical protein
LLLPEAVVDEPEVPEEGFPEPEVLPFPELNFFPPPFWFCPELPPV